MDRAAGKTDSTLKTYGRFLDAFAAWLGERDPADVTKLAELEEWLDHWEAAYQARYGKAPSQNTVRNHETALSTFYDFLYRREYVEVTPMGRLQRTRRGKSKKGDHLSQSEFNALLDEPLTPQEKIIIPALRLDGGPGIRTAVGVSRRRRR